MLDYRTESKEIILDMYRYTNDITIARNCALMAAQRLQNTYPPYMTRLIRHYDLVLAEIPKVKLKEIK
jgi:hypothetical protein